MPASATGASPVQMTGARVADTAFSSANSGTGTTALGAPSCARREQVRNEPGCRPGSTTAAVLARWHLQATSGMGVLTVCLSPWPSPPSMSRSARMSERLLYATHSSQDGFPRNRGLVKSSHFMDLTLRWEETDSGRETEGRQGTAQWNDCRKEGAKGALTEGEGGGLGGPEGVCPVAGAPKTWQLNRDLNDKRTQPCQHLRVKYSRQGDRSWVGEERKGSQRGWGSASRVSPIQSPVSHTLTSLPHVLQTWDDTETCRHNNIPMPGHAWRGLGVLGTQ